MFMSMASLADLPCFAPTNQSIMAVRDATSQQAGPVLPTSMNSEERKVAKPWKGPKTS
jgi:hypothetical protein